MDEERKALLKALPKIDELLLSLEGRGDVKGVSPGIVKAICRTEVEKLRTGILAGRKDRTGPLTTLEVVAENVVQALRRLQSPRLRRVVNATGVILHTNLGRAPLSREAVNRILEVGRGYSNLEFDLVTGERGLRYDHIRDLLCLLTGAEDALVVNNNAAAVLLVLNSLAEGKEAVVSRGELVEIGGEFRIPDVMEKSGGRLREVGTTNRTRLKDYEAAIGPETALIMKVHTSNFRIIGFTEETGVVELAALGKRYGIPVMDDLGSGCLIDLRPYGLPGEPTVSEVLDSGVDVVTFSGDKLLAGPQAGLIMGKRAVLEKIKRNPLNRALRIDKLTLAALEGTLIQYLNPQACPDTLHVLKALTETVADVRKRAKRLKTLLQKLHRERLTVHLVPGYAMAGGGSLPGQGIPTALLRLAVQGLSPSALESRFRGLDVPIIARIEEEQVLLDARTLMDDDLPLIRAGVARILADLDD
jgi:L-seryl-tRNA(Ser) seleniumtransferase